MEHRNENEQNINTIKKYDIILLKDKNLNILSLRTPFYHFYIFIIIWFIRVISP